MLQQRTLYLGDDWCTEPSICSCRRHSHPQRDRKQIGLGQFAGAGGFDLGFTMASST